MSPAEIEVEIDGLNASVNAEDWGADPKAVTEHVRKARRDMALTEDQYEPAPTYDEEHGDDSAEDA